MRKANPHSIIARTTLTPRSSPTRSSPLTAHLRTLVFRNPSPRLHLLDDVDRRRAFLEVVHQHVGNHLVERFAVCWAAWLSCGQIGAWWKHRQTSHRCDDSTQLPDVRRLPVATSIFADVTLESLWWVPSCCSEGLANFRELLVEDVFRRNSAAEIAEDDGWELIVLQTVGALHVEEDVSGLDVQMADCVPFLWLEVLFERVDETVVAQREGIAEMVDAMPQELLVEQLVHLLLLLNPVLDGIAVAVLQDQDAIGCAVRPVGLEICISM